jgi:hypothetical protein
VQPDRRRFIWEEKVPLSMVKGETDIEKLRVNRRQNTVLIENYVS